MEIQNTSIETRNDGRAIRYYRRKRGMKQDLLATEVRMTQQAVSRYEQLEIIEDDILEKFAKALDVSVDDIKQYQDDAKTIIFENNTFGDHDKITGYVEEDHSTTNFNPIEKVIELYERLLQTEKDKNDTIEKRLSDIEKRLSAK